MSEPTFMNPTELRTFFRDVINGLVLRQPLSSDQLLRNLASNATRDTPHLAAWLELFIGAKYPLLKGARVEFREAFLKVKAELGPENYAACKPYTDILRLEATSPFPWAYRRFRQALNGRDLLHPELLVELVELQKRHFKRGIKASSRIRDICADERHFAGEAFFEDLVAKAAFEQSNFEVALALSKRSVALWEDVVKKKPHFRLQLAASYRLHGRILQQQPQPVRREACQNGDWALDAVKVYLEEYDTLNVRYREHDLQLVTDHLKAHIMRSLSGALRDSNRLDRAAELGIEALRLFKSLHRSEHEPAFKHRVGQRDIVASIAATHETLAGIYLGLKELDKAYAHCRKSEKWFREFDKSFQTSKTVQILFTIYHPSRAHLFMTTGRILEARAFAILVRQMSFPPWTRIGANSSTRGRSLASFNDLLLEASEYYLKAEKSYVFLNVLATTLPHQMVDIRRSAVAMQRRGFVTLAMGRSSNLLNEAIDIFELAKTSNERFSMYLASALCDKADLLQRSWIAAAGARANEVEAGLEGADQDWNPESVALYRRSVDLCRASLQTLGNDDYSDVYKGHVESAYLSLITFEVAALHKLEEDDEQRNAGNPDSAAFRLIHLLEDLRYFDLTFLGGGAKPDGPDDPKENASEQNDPEYLPASKYLAYFDSDSSINDAGAPETNKNPLCNTREQLKICLASGARLYTTLQNSGSDFLWVQNALDACGDQRIAFISLSIKASSEEDTSGKAASGELTVCCELASPALTDDLLILNLTMPTCVYATPAVAGVRGPKLPDYAKCVSNNLRSLYEFIRGLTRAMQNHPTQLRKLLRDVIDLVFACVGEAGDFPRGERKLVLDHTHDFILKVNTSRHDLPEWVASHLQGFIQQGFIAIGPPQLPPSAVLVVHRIINAMGQTLYGDLPRSFQNRFRAFRSRPDHVRLCQEKRPVIFLSPCARTINTPFELFKDRDDDSIIASDLRPEDEFHWTGYLGTDIFMPRLHSVQELTEIVARGPQKDGAEALLAINSAKPVRIAGDDEVGQISKQTLTRMKRLASEMKSAGIQLVPDGELLAEEGCNQRSLLLGLHKTNLALSFYVGHGRFAGRAVYGFALSLYKRERLSLWKIREELSKSKHTFPGTIFFFHSCSSGQSMPLPGNRFRGLPSLLIGRGGSCVVASSYPVREKSGSLFVRIISRNIKRNKIQGPRRISNWEIDQRTRRDVALSPGAARVDGSNLETNMADMIINSRVELAIRTGNPLEWCLFVLYGNPWCELPFRRLTAPASI